MKERLTDNDGVFGGISNQCESVEKQRRGKRIGNYKKQRKQGLNLRGGPL